MYAKRAISSRLIGCTFNARADAVLFFIAQIPTNDRFFGLAFCSCLTMSRKRIFYVKVFT